MVVGTLSLVQKGQTSGFSGCSHRVDTSIKQWQKIFHSPPCQVYLLTSPDLAFLHDKHRKAQNVHIFKCITSVCDKYRKYVHQNSFQNQIKFEYKW